MKPSEKIKRAGRILAEGGVVAYPTEGVFGLGCRPDCLDGVARILHMKQRDPAMGLILIASHPNQLEPWTSVDLSDPRLASTEQQPVTWVVPAAPGLPFWIRGKHQGVAVRLTRHPVAAALCDAAQSALVSTSANRSGQPAARTTYVLRRQFRDVVDFIVPGACGPSAGPSEIRRFSDNQIIRAAS